MDNHPVKFAQVLADVPFLHTDHTYDYTIPDRFQSLVQIGMRVKVKFGGRNVLGYVVGITDITEHKAAGEILEMLDVFPVVKPDIQILCTEIARRYLTAQSQVLNFAIPSAAKRVNQRLLTEIPEALATFASESHSEKIESSTSYLLCPTIDVLDWTAKKVVGLIEQDKRGVVLLPDYAMLHSLEAVIKKNVPSVQIGVIAADMTASQRYEQFMKVWRDETHIVIGTRSAVFAPLSKLDFIFMVNENDDSFVEQQSGNWHVRDVAIVRCDLTKASFYSVGYSRSVEVQYLIQNHRLLDVKIEGIRPVKTMIVPRDDSSNSHMVRMPTVAFNVIRQGIRKGPVLLQVPMRGYQLNIQCAKCREKAACDECGGGLERSAQEMTRCTRCGRKFGQFRCQWCSHTQVRSITLGAVRTAEEIGKAFPQTPIYTSGKNGILSDVENNSSLIIATPGAEPRVRDGLYQAVVILDPEITLNRIDLRAHEEAFRRWYNLKSLVDPDGVQLICTHELHQVIRFIITDDPGGFAEFQLRERIAALLPPATESYLVEGDYENVSKAVEEVSKLSDVLLLGPAEHKQGSYALFQSSHEGNQLNRALRAILARRSSSKAKGTLRVRFSPQVLP